MYYLNNFLFFSIFGHLLEKIFNYGGTSGILYFYWTPIYGFTVLLLYYLFDKLNKKKYKTSLRIFYLFLIGFLFITFLEFLGGSIIERFFGIVFWNYSKLKFNIGKYICLEMALLWGTCSIILYYTKPFFDKLLEKIPKFITYILTSGMIIDLICTIIFRIKA